MPQLTKLVWTGKHIDKATLVAYRSAGDAGKSQLGVPYLKIEFESVIITHLDISGSGDTSPTVSFAINYAKITYTYNQQDHTKGTVGADQPVSHDLRTNEVA